MWAQRKLENVACPKPKRIAVQMKRLQVGQTGENVLFKGIPNVVN